MQSRSYLRAVTPFLVLVVWVGSVLGLSASGAVPLREGRADLSVPSTTSTVVIVLEEAGPGGPPDTDATEEEGRNLTTSTSAAPAETESGAGTPTEETYVVEEGDSPHSIAADLGVSVERLMELNGIDDPRNLKVGAVLVVPEE